jgi:hypothetical protein
MASGSHTKTVLLFIPPKRIRASAKLLLLVIEIKKYSDALALSGVFLYQAS